MVIIIIIMLIIVTLGLVCRDVTQHSPRCVTSQKRLRGRLMMMMMIFFFFGQRDQCLNFLKTR